MKYLRAILTKEIQSDFRNPYALGGALLFLISTAFISYIALRKLSSSSTWTALFWIVLLFTGFNAVGKSFSQETRKRLLYLFTLIRPEAYIIAKIGYHGSLMLILSSGALLLFSLLFPLSVTDFPLFVCSAVSGGFGIGVVLSLLSSIASRAGSSMTLLAVLSMPVMLPMLLVNITLMKNAIDGLDWSVQAKYLLVSLGLDGVTIALALILFPYLWRE